MSEKIDTESNAIEDSKPEKAAAKVECSFPGNPTGKHDMFKPEDGKSYCRYCGKTD